MCLQHTCNNHFLPCARQIVPKRQFAAIKRIGVLVNFEYIPPNKRARSARMCGVLKYESLRLAIAMAQ